MKILHVAAATLLVCIGPALVLLAAFVRRRQSGVDDRTNFR